jgi:hypothetical protein
MISIIERFPTQAERQMAGLQPGVSIPIESPFSCHRALNTMLKRTALGFAWCRGGNGGPYTYLNRADQITLLTTLYESSSGLNAFRTYEVIE